MYKVISPSSLRPVPGLCFDVGLSSPLFRRSLIIRNFQPYPHLVLLDLHFIQSPSNQKDFLRVCIMIFSTYKDGVEHADVNTNELYSVKRIYVE